MMQEVLPSISIVVPTFNSARTLDKCLASIRKQDYPTDKLELIIADAGSSDETLDIANKYHADAIVDNSLITGEAGKAVGVGVASNEIIALIDSDNVLDGIDWLKRMVEPFIDVQVVGSEPLYYTYRKDDTLINRYCALLGMNDPLCLYLGNYDRFSQVTGRWTGEPVRVTEQGKYLLLELDKNHLPTIGANGFLVRRTSLMETRYKPYLFDIDVVHQLVEVGKNKIAKVDIGITHLFANTTSDFVRKQKRRIRDYLYFQGRNMRTYPWRKSNKVGLAKFLLATLLIIPLVVTACRGYLKVHDKAWLFHLPACWITLIVYGSLVIADKMGLKTSDRGRL